VFWQILIAVFSFMLAKYMGPLGGYFFPANLWLFMAGSVLFAMFARCSFEIPQAVKPLTLGYIVLVLGGVGAITSYTLHTLLLCSIVALIPLLFMSFKKSQADKFVGNLSYPVYLLHMPIATVVGSGLHSKPALLVAAVSIALAVPIALFVDEPLDAYRQNRAQKTLSMRH
jgi:peptidoglycan/LPS O-acetylase OafA/YrhL